MDTFFGKAAALIEGAESKGHLQDVLKKVGLTCLGSILLWVIIELAVQFGPGLSGFNANTHPPLGVQDPKFWNVDFLFFPFSFTYLFIYLFSFMDQILAVEEKTIVRHY